MKSIACVACGTVLTITYALTGDPETGCVGGWLIGCGLAGMVWSQ